MSSRSGRVQSAPSLRPSNPSPKLCSAQVPTIHLTAAGRRRAASLPSETAAAAAAGVPSAAPRTPSPLSQATGSLTRHLSRPPPHTHLSTPPQRGIHSRSPQTPSSSSSRTTLASTSPASTLLKDQMPSCTTSSGGAVNTPGRDTWTGRRRWCRIT